MATVSTCGEQAPAGLMPGAVVVTELTGRRCEIGRHVGRGSQGDVFEAVLDATPVAIKWYLPSWARTEQHEALRVLVRRGPPGPGFLWPIDVVSIPGTPGFGYVMPLREHRFHSMADLMRRRVDPTFHTIATAGMWLAHHFLLLHTQGLCYRDVSFGNVFFDPATGDVLICDNDNVGIDGARDNPLLGTPRFMAPEIVRGDAAPSSVTDLHSLAVLLFYMLVLAHPLEPVDQASPDSLDLDAMRHLYGSQPAFGYDAAMPTEVPLDATRVRSSALWGLYPGHLRQLFVRSFTLGLSDPGARVREGEWREELASLRDARVYCAGCAAENFVETDASPRPVTAGCWRCGDILRMPPHLRLPSDVVMFNHDTRLHPHHLDPNCRWDFSRCLAAVTQHQRTGQWGLRNDSLSPWRARCRDDTAVVEPGRTVRLVVGLRIDFGLTEGTVGGATGTRGGIQS